MLSWILLWKSTKYCCTVTAGLEQIGTQVLHASPAGRNSVYPSFTFQVQPTSFFLIVHYRLCVSIFHYRLYVSIFQYRLCVSIFQYRLCVSTVISYWTVQQTIALVTWWMALSFTPMWLHDHCGWLGVEYHSSNKQLFQRCWWVWQLKVICIAAYQFYFIYMDGNNKKKSMVYQLY